MRSLRRLRGRKWQKKTRLPQTSFSKPHAIPACCFGFFAILVSVSERRQVFCFFRFKSPLCGPLLEKRQVLFSSFFSVFKPLRAFLCGFLFCADTSGRPGKRSAKKQCLMAAIVTVWGRKSTSNLAEKHFCFEPSKPFPSSAFVAFEDLSQAHFLLSLFFCLSLKKSVFVWLSAFVQAFERRQGVLIFSEPSNKSVLEFALVFCRVFFFCRCLRFHLPALYFLFDVVCCLFFIFLFLLGRSLELSYLFDKF